MYIYPLKIKNIVLYCIEAALVFHVSRLYRSTLARICTPLTKSEEKEGLLAV